MPKNIQRCHYVKTSRNRAIIMREPEFSRVVQQGNDKVRFYSMQLVGHADAYAARIVCEALNQSALIEKDEDLPPRCRAILEAWHQFIQDTPEGVTAPFTTEHLRKANII